MNKIAQAYKIGALLDPVKLLSKNSLSGLRSRLSRVIPGSAPSKPSTLLAQAYRGLGTPVSKLTRGQQVAAGTGALGLGAALGHEMGQPILEILKGIPDAQVSELFTKFNQKQLLESANAKNLEIAQGYLKDAVSALPTTSEAGTIINKATRDLVNQRLVDPLNTELASKLTSFSRNQLEPQARSLAGLLGLASTGQLGQDLVKAVPVVGISGDISGLARQLAVLKSLDSPEVLGKIREAYKPLVGEIADPIKRNIKNEAERLIVNTSSPALRDYAKAREAITPNLPSTFEATRDQLKRVTSISPNKLLETRINELLPATKTTLNNQVAGLDSRLVNLTRQISSPLNLLENNSPYLPIPRSVVGADTARAGGSDLVASNIRKNALEAAAKAVAKAGGKQIPGLGWAAGLLDSAYSAQANQFFDRYITGATTPGGNLFVGKDYYSPALEKLYTNLKAPAGAVDSLYQKSVDPNYIKSTSEELMDKIIASRSKS